MKAVQAVGFPAGWEPQPLWSLFRRKSRTGYPDEPLLSVYRDYGVVERGFTDDNWNFLPDDVSKYQLVEPGDIVVNKMKAWQGSLGVSSLRGVVSPAYFVYAPTKAGHEVRFLNYLLRSQPLIESYQQMSDGVRVNQWDLDPWGFSRLLLPTPRRVEQAAIADFLDRETAHIDALIEKQHALIDLLRERRDAVLEPPLDPDTPQIRLSYRLDTLAGQAFASEGFSTDSNDIRLLRGVNVKPGMTDWSKTVYWPVNDTDRYVRYQLRAGDLVMGLDRPFVGSGTRVAAVQEHDLPALLVQRVARFRTTGNLDPDYALLLLRSRAFREYAEPEFTGVSVPHLSESQVTSFRWPVPSLDAQRDFASAALRAAQAIDVLIAKAERFIELARERRSALITAAVTGQIDVTGITKGVA